MKINLASPLPASNPTFKSIPNFTIFRSAYMGPKFVFIKFQHKPYWIWKHDGPLDGGETALVDDNTEVVVIDKLEFFFKPSEC